jgi:hypothetical protein
MMRIALHEVAQVLLKRIRTWASSTLCLGDGDLPLPKPTRSTTLAVNLLVSGECRLKCQAKKQERSYRVAYERDIFS